MTTKINAISSLYIHNKITFEALYASVPKVISADEFEKIVGVKFDDVKTNTQT